MRKKSVRRSSSILDVSSATQRSTVAARRIRPDTLDDDVSDPTDAGDPGNGTSAALVRRPRALHRFPPGSELGVAALDTDARASFRCPQMTNRGSSVAVLVTVMPCAVWIEAVETRLEVDPLRACVGHVGVGGARSSV